jgi:uncharacterized membrane protein
VSAPGRPVSAAALASTGAPRFDRLDALRGAAIVWMVLFHWAFSLNHFGYFELRHNFHRDALWTNQRVVILSTFLLCAGLGQAVALQAAQAWPRFWRRWGQVVLAAALVSAGSALMFPRSWIFFGVLHGMAVMLVLARLAAPLGAWLWPLGAAALLLPRLLQLPGLSVPHWSWLGLVTHKPLTEDFVPVLPWLGVMLWGLALGQWVLRRRPSLMTGALPAPLQPLARIGRWPLTIYLLHQPLFIGALLLGQRLGVW